MVDGQGKGWKDVAEGPGLADKGTVGEESTPGTPTRGSWEPQSCLEPRDHQAGRGYRAAQSRVKSYVQNDGGRQPAGFSAPPAGRAAFLSPVPAVLSGLGSGQISWEIAFAFVWKVKLAS